MKRSKNKDITDEIQDLRELAERKDIFVNQIHPAIKLITTIIYLLCLTSLSKYQLQGVILYAIYPIAMMRFSQIPIRESLHKVWGLFPVVCLIGLVNPVFDNDVIFYIGRFGMTGGVISALTFAMKGVLAVMSAVLLVCTTTIEDICQGLKMMHLPNPLITMLLLMYRYLSVLQREARCIWEAYRLRAPGQKGIHWKAWGSLVGMLLLRSMERAQEVYASMQMRGFSGTDWITGTEQKKPHRNDYLYGGMITGVLILIRVFIGIGVLT